jgi:PD-(D/E)XK nuclease superfamily
MIVNPTGTEIAVSNSELFTYKECQRKWFLSYYLGYQIPAARANPTSSSRLGSRLHAALEARYGHGLDPLLILRAIYDKAAEDYPSAADELAKEYDYAVAIIEGYLQWLTETGADSNLIPLEAERKISVVFAVINGITVYLTARIDAVLEQKDTGAVILMDHKSTATFEGKEILLPINEQGKTQALIQRMQAAADPSIEYTIDAIVFNMLRKVKRTANANPPFYQRNILPFNNAEMQSMWRRIHFTITRMLETRAALDAVFANPNSTAEQYEEAQQYYAPPTPSEDCSWKCPFLQLCPMMDDGSRWEDALDANYERGNPYQYLDTGLLDELIAQNRI